MILDIYAVIYGANRDIADISLQEGGSIIKASTEEQEILDILGENDSSSLESKYWDALIGNHELLILKGHYEVDGIQTHDERDEYIDKHVQLVINQMRIMRLAFEGYLYVKKYFYSFKEIDRKRTSEFKGCFSSYDVSIEKGGIKAPIDANSICLAKKLSMVSLPLRNEWIQRVFLMYEKSFTKDIEVAYVSVITALEMIFVTSNKGIKECLAKRVAVYLADEREKRNEIYYKIRKLYSKRCKFVHNGENDEISKEELWYVRNIVRKVVIQFVESTKTKQEFCQELIDKVEMTEYWRERF